MRVIAKPRFHEFWETHADAEGPLSAWYTLVNNKNTAWQLWADVKAMYPSADQVGYCEVFNIKGNKYRLITRIRYKTQIVYVLKVMTHSEYGKDKWKDECGCFTPPPK